MTIPFSKMGELKGFFRIIEGEAQMDNMEENELI